MRAIRKTGGGTSQLNQVHRTPPTTDRAAAALWRRFRPHKTAVQQCLLNEQYQLCCYSELRADEEGLGYHIEHVENKSQNPARTFDYTNLAASALSSAHGLSDLKAQGHEVFGGHAAGKQKSVDMTRFVSCHQPDCRRFFAYLSDGRVMPAQGLSAQDADKASYTITLLNLNSPYLITRRRQWWDELDRLFQEHINHGWSLPHLLAVDLVPSGDKISRFFSLTRQFFGVVAEQTLKDEAPSLL